MTPGAHRRDARPKIKICGVTSSEDAVMAVELGADYLGLNFYPPSPRAIEVSQGAAIREAVAGRVPLVGVFVNRPLDEVADIEQRAGLELVQFHGDEPLSAIEPWAGRAIKVLRVGNDWTPEQLAPWRGFWAVLFDTPRGGDSASRLWGGTGESWEFQEIGAALHSQRVFVAGGIGPDNVARVAGALDGVWGIDVCSGVESSPGVKDRAKLVRLFEEIKDGQGQDNSHS